VDLVKTESNSISLNLVHGALDIEVAPLSGRLATQMPGCERVHEGANKPATRREYPSSLSHRARGIVHVLKRHKCHDKIKRILREREGGGVAQDDLLVRPGTRCQLSQQASGIQADHAVSKLVEREPAASLTAA
jgi:hypothetical protein